MKKITHILLFTVAVYLTSCGDEDEKKASTLDIAGKIDQSFRTDDDAWILVSNEVGEILGSKKIESGQDFEINDLPGDIDTRFNLTILKAYRIQGGDNIWTNYEIKTYGKVTVNNNFLISDFDFPGMTQKTIDVAIVNIPQDYPTITTSNDGYFSQIFYPIDGITPYEFNGSSYAYNGIATVTTNSSKLVISIGSVNEVPVYFESNSPFSLDGLNLDYATDFQEFENYLEVGTSDFGFISVLGFTPLGIRTQPEESAGIHSSRIFNVNNINGVFKLGYFDNSLGYFTSASTAFGVFEKSGDLPDPSELKKPTGYDFNVSSRDINNFQFTVEGELQFFDSFWRQVRLDDNGRLTDNVTWKYAGPADQIANKLIASFPEEITSKYPILLTIEDLDLELDYANFYKRLDGSSYDDFIVSELVNHKQEIATYTQYRFFKNKP